MQVRVLHPPHISCPSILLIALRQSYSYILFRESIQEIFSFAVIVTASIPVLKQNIKIYREGKIGRLPDNDYFQPSVVYVIKQSTIDKLKELKVDDDKLVELTKLLNQTMTSNDFKVKVVSAIGEPLYKQHRNILKKQSDDYINNLESSTSGYQKKLATYLYFSAFSFFEAYIVDLAKEVVAQFSRIDKKTYLDGHGVRNDLKNLRSKLAKQHFPGHEGRYIKISKILNSEGYKTPTDLLFTSSLELLEEKINDLKANDIPVFLEKILFFKMSEADKLIFHTLRDQRNSIGHGRKAYAPTLSDVIVANKFFKRVSSEIDEHVVFHFFQLPRFNA